jgi:hypothetical protein
MYFFSRTKRNKVKKNVSRRNKKRGGSSPHITDLPVLLRSPRPRANSIGDLSFISGYLNDLDNTRISSQNNSDNSFSSGYLNNPDNMRHSSQSSISTRSNSSSSRASSSKSPSRSSSSRSSSSRSSSSKPKKASSVKNNIFENIQHDYGVFNSSAFKLSKPKSYTKHNRTKYKLYNGTL